MPKVSLLNTITFAISVRDRHSSARWYNDMLGFELLHHLDEAGWSEMKTKTDGVTLGLGEHAEPAPGQCGPGVWRRGHCHVSQSPGNGWRQV